jgi:hypothetical protein
MTKRASKCFFRCLQERATAVHLSRGSSAGKNNQSHSKIRPLDDSLTNARAQRFTAHLAPLQ